MDFTLENLDAAKTAFQRLKNRIIEIKKNPVKSNDLTKQYESEFLEAINDDLNTPKALQVLWKTLDNLDFDSKKKIALLKKFDSVLSLGIKDFKEEKTEIPKELKKLLEQREKLRKEKKFAESDIVRNQIKELGYMIEDSPEGPIVRKN